MVDTSVCAYVTTARRYHPLCSVHRCLPVDIHRPLCPTFQPTYMDKPLYTDPHAPPRPTMDTCTRIPLFIPPIYPPTYINAYTKFTPSAPFSSPGHVLRDIPCLPASALTLTPLPICSLLPLFLSPGHGGVSPDIYRPLRAHLYPFCSGDGYCTTKIRGRDSSGRF